MFKLKIVITLKQENLQGNRQVINLKKEVPFERKHK